MHFVSAFLLLLCFNLHIQKGVLLPLLSENKGENQKRTLSTTDLLGSHVTHRYKKNQEMGVLLPLLSENKGENQKRTLSTTDLLGSHVTHRYKKPQEMRKDQKRAEQKEGDEERVTTGEAIELLLPESEEPSLTIRSIFTLNNKTLLKPAVNGKDETPGVVIGTAPFRQKLQSSNTRNLENKNVSNNEPIYRKHKRLKHFTRKPARRDSKETVRYRVKRKDDNSKKSEKTSTSTTKRYLKTDEANVFYEESYEDSSKIRESGEILTKGFGTTDESFEYYDDSPKITHTREKSSTIDTSFFTIGESRVRYEEANKDSSRIKRSEDHSTISDFSSLTTDDDSSEELSSMDSLSAISLTGNSNKEDGHFKTDSENSSKITDNFSIVFDEGNAAADFFFLKDHEDSYENSSAILISENPSLTTAKSSFLDDGTNEDGIIPNRIGHSSINSGGTLSTAGDSNGRQTDYFFTISENPSLTTAQSSFLDDGTNEDGIIPNEIGHSSINSIDTLSTAGDSNGRQTDSFFTISENPSLTTAQSSFLDDGTNEDGIIPNEIGHSFINSIDTLSTAGDSNGRQTDYFFTISENPSLTTAQSSFLDDGTNEDGIIPNEIGHSFINSIDTLSTAGDSNGRQTDYFFTISENPSLTTAQSSFLDDGTNEDGIIPNEIGHSFINSIDTLSTAGDSNGRQTDSFFTISENPSLTTAQSSFLDDGTNEDGIIPNEIGHSFINSIDTLSTAGDSNGRQTDSFFTISENPSLTTAQSSFLDDGTNEDGIIPNEIGHSFINSIDTLSTAGDSNGRQTDSFFTISENPSLTTAQSSFLDDGTNEDGIIPNEIGHSFINSIDTLSTAGDSNGRQTDYFFTISENPSLTTAQSSFLDDGTNEDGIIPNEIGHSFINSIDTLSTAGDSNGRQTDYFFTISENPSLTTAQSSFLDDGTNEDGIIPNEIGHSFINSIDTLSTAGDSNGRQTDSFFTISENPSLTTAQSSFLDDGTNEDGIIPNEIGHSFINSIDTLSTAGDSNGRQTDSFFTISENPSLTTAQSSFLDDGTNEDGIIPNEIGHSFINSIDTLSTAGDSNGRQTDYFSAMNSEALSENPVLEEDSSGIDNEFNEGTYETTATPSEGKRGGTVYTLMDISSDMDVKKTGKFGDSSDGLEVKMFNATPERVLELEGSNSERDKTFDESQKTEKSSEERVEEIVSNSAKLSLPSSDLNNVDIEESTKDESYILLTDTKRSNEENSENQTPNSEAYASSREQRSEYGTSSHTEVYLESKIFNEEKNEKTGFPPEKMEERMKKFKNGQEEVMKKIGSSISDESISDESISDESIFDESTKNESSRGEKVDDTLYSFTEMSSLSNSLDQGETDESSFPTHDVEESTNAERSQKENQESTSLTSDIKVRSKFDESFNNDYSNEEILEKSVTTVTVMSLISPGLDKAETRESSFPSHDVEVTTNAERSQKENPESTSLTSGIEERSESDEYFNNDHSNEENVEESVSIFTDISLLSPDLDEAGFPSHDVEERTDAEGSQKENQESTSLTSDIKVRSKFDESFNNDYSNEEILEKSVTTVTVLSLISPGLDKAETRESSFPSHDVEVTTNAERSQKENPESTSLTSGIEERSESDEYFNNDHSNEENVEESVSIFTDISLLSPDLDEAGFPSHDVEERTDAEGSQKENQESTSLTSDIKVRSKFDESFNNDYSNEEILEKSVTTVTVLSLISPGLDKAETRESSFPSHDVEVTTNAERSQKENPESTSLTSGIEERLESDEYFNKDHLYEENVEESVSILTDISLLSPDLDEAQKGESSFQTHDVEERTDAEGSQKENQESTSFTSDIEETLESDESFNNDSSNEENIEESVSIFTVTPLLSPGLNEGENGESSFPSHVEVRTNAERLQKENQESTSFTSGIEETLESDESFNNDSSNEEKIEESVSLFTVTPLLSPGVYEAQKGESSFPSHDVEERTNAEGSQGDYQNYTSLPNRKEIYSVSIALNDEEKEDVSFPPHELEERVKNNKKISQEEFESSENWTRKTSKSDEFVKSGVSKEHLHNSKEVLSFPNNLDEAAKEESNLPSLSFPNNLDEAAKEESNLPSLSFPKNLNETAKEESNLSSLSFPNNLDEAAKEESNLPSRNVERIINAEGSQGGYYATSLTSGTPIFLESVTSGTSNVGVTIPALIDMSSLTRSFYEAETEKSVLLIDKVDERFNGEDSHRVHQDSPSTNAEGSPKENQESTSLTSGIEETAESDESFNNDHSNEENVEKPVSTFTLMSLISPGLDKAETGESSFPSHDAEERTNAERSQKENQESTSLTSGVKETSEYDEFFNNDRSYEENVEESVSTFTDISLLSPDYHHVQNETREIPISEEIAPSGSVNEEYIEETISIDIKISSPSTVLDHAGALKLRFKPGIAEGKKKKEEFKGDEVSPSIINGTGGALLSDEIGTSGFSNADKANEAPSPFTAFSSLSSDLDSTETRKFNDLSGDEGKMNAKGSEEDNGESSSLTSRTNKILESDDITTSVSSSAEHFEGAVSVSKEISSPSTVSGNAGALKLRFKPGIAEGKNKKEESKEDEVSPSIIHGAGETLLSDEIGTSGFSNEANEAPSPFTAFSSLSSDLDSTETRKFNDLSGNEGKMNAKGSQEDNGESSSLTSRTNKILESDDITTSVYSSAEHIEGAVSVSKEIPAVSTGLNMVKTMESSFPPNDADRRMDEEDSQEDYIDSLGLASWTNKILESDDITTSVSSSAEHIEGAVSVSKEIPAVSTGLNIVKTMESNFPSNDADRRMDEEDSQGDYIDSLGLTSDFQGVSSVENDGYSSSTSGTDETHVSDKTSTSRNSNEENGEEIGVPLTQISSLSSVSDKGESLSSRVTSVDTERSFNEEVSNEVTEGERSFTLINTGVIINTSETITSESSNVEEKVSAFTELSNNLDEVETIESSFPSDEVEGRGNKKYEVESIESSFPSDEVEGRGNKKDSQEDGEGTSASTRETGKTLVSDETSTSRPSNGAAETVSHFIQISSLSSGLEKAEIEESSALSVDVERRMDDEDSQRDIEESSGVTSSSDETTTSEFLSEESVSDFTIISSLVSGLVEGEIGQSSANEIINAEDSQGDDEKSPNATPLSDETAKNELYSDVSVFENTRISSLSSSLDEGNTQKSSVLPDNAKGRLNAEDSLSGDEKSPSVTSLSDETAIDESLSEENVSDFSEISLLSSGSDEVETEESNVPSVEVAGIINEVVSPSDDVRSPKLISEIGKTPISDKSVSYSSYTEGISENNFPNSTEISSLPSILVSSKFEGLSFSSDDVEGRKNDIEDILEYSSSKMGASIPGTLYFEEAKHSKQAEEFTVKSRPTPALPFGTLQKAHTKDVCCGHGHHQSNGRIIDTLTLKPANATLYVKKPHYGSRTEHKKHSKHVLKGGCFTEDNESNEFESREFEMHYRSLKHLLGVTGDSLLVAYFRHFRSDSTHDRDVQNERNLATTALTTLKRRPLKKRKKNPERRFKDHRAASSRSEKPSTQILDDLNFDWLIRRTLRPPHLQKRLFGYKAGRDSPSFLRTIKLLPS